MSFNLAVMLRESRHARPDHPLCHISDLTFSYTEVDEISGRVASALLGTGLRRGDKVAVLPLSRNADLSPKARDIAAVLRKRWNTDFDDASAIGRRYRRQDEIGTPYCVTVDFDSLEDQAVTVRERDSMAQVRIGIDALPDYLADRLPAW